jgi:FixJ family two-component response regulator
MTAQISSSQQPGAVNSPVTRPIVYNISTMKKGPMTILIADDDDNVRRSIAAYLEDGGHTIHHASDGKQAVAKFLKHSPDLCLVDMRMPVMDGLEAIREILKEKADQPIIVISAAGQVSVAMEAIHSGAWDYLVKPIDDLSILSFAIDKAMEKQSLRQQVREYQEHLEQQVAQRTADLQTANESLQNKTIALREVVNTVQGEKREALQGISQQIEQTVMPLLNRLRESAPQICRPIADNIEQSLRRIAEAQGEPLTQLAGSLTPTELRICRHIRREMTSKEIAQAEGVSPDTIETHRRNIRRKLKIANEQVNLTAYLQSLPELAS